MEKILQKVGKEETEAVILLVDTSRKAQAIARKYRPDDPLIASAKGKGKSNSLK